MFVNNTSTLWRAAEKARESAWIEDKKDLIRVLLIFVLITSLLLQADSTKVPGAHVQSLELRPPFDLPFIRRIQLTTYLAAQQELYLFHRFLRE